MTQDDVESGTAAVGAPPDRGRFGDMFALAQMHGASSGSSESEEEEESAPPTTVHKSDAEVAKALDLDRFAQGPQVEAVEPAGEPEGGAPIVMKSLAVLRNMHAWSSLAGLLVGNLTGFGLAMVFLQEKSA